MTLIATEPAASAVIEPFTEKFDLWRTDGPGFADRPTGGCSSSGSCATASNKTAVLAALFGHMVRIAAPIVEHYRGDLFHDARWLDANVDGPRSFVWRPYDSGTWIDDVGGALHQAAGTSAAGSRWPWWLVEVTHENSRWCVAFTRLAEGGIEKEVP